MINADPYDDYLNEIKDTPMSRFNLVAPKGEVSLNELVNEGMKLLEEEEKNKSKSPPPKKKLKDESKQLESKLASTSTNPYIKARTEILAKMSPADVKAIERMDAGLEPKDDWYNRFVDKIVELGNRYSE